MEACYDELEKNGCTILAEIIGRSTLEDALAALDRFATEELRRRGTPQVAFDALTDLLRTSGEYRRVLFPLLVGFLPLRRLQLEVTEWIEASGFCERMGIEVPTITFALKADVPGEAKYLLPLHQDYGTPTHRAYRFWIALRDASVETGTMRYVPGSHSAGFIEHDDSDPVLPRLPEDMFDEGAFRTLELAAGDAFVFHPLLAHASVPATGDRMKYALIVNVWDLAALADPADAEDPINQRVRMIQERNRARGDKDPIKLEGGEGGRSSVPVQGGGRT